MRNSYYVVVLVALVTAVYLASVYQAKADIVTKITPVGPHPVTVSETDLNFVFTPAVATNVNVATDIDRFISTGKELLIVQFNIPVGNPVVSATFQLRTVPDSLGRKNDINEYLLGAATPFAAFTFSAVAGWKNATGYVQIQASTSAIEWAVFQLPR